MCVTSGERLQANENGILFCLIGRRFHFRGKNLRWGGGGWGPGGDHQQERHRHRWIRRIADIPVAVSFFSVSCLFRARRANPRRIAAAIMHRSHQIETNGQNPREWRVGQSPLTFGPGAATGSDPRFGEELPSRRTAIFSTVVARELQSSHLFRLLLFFYSSSCCWCTCLRLDPRLFNSLMDCDVLHPLPEFSHLTPSKSIHPSIHGCFRVISSFFLCFVAVFVIGRPDRFKVTGFGPPSSITNDKRQTTNDKLEMNK